MGDRDTTDERLSDLAIFLPATLADDALDTLVTKLRGIDKVQAVSVHFSTTGGQSPGPVVVLMDFDGSTPTEAVADVLWSGGYTGAGEAAAQLVAEHGAPFQRGKFARVQVWAEPASSRTRLH